MAIYPIRTFPDPVLTIAAGDVTEFGDALAKLADDMFETMYAAPGVGLAAPQIGVSKRLFVADVGEGPFAMANPEVIEEAGSWKFEEGCLSVPDHYWIIKRRDYVRAIGLDVEGNPVECEGDELLGRVIQHEIDHLDGTLLLSHLGTRARNQALKELREALPGVRRLP
jgi:peptide deformylase